MRDKFGVLDQKHGICLGIKFDLDRLVYSVALWRRKTPNFAIFWTSAFCGVANWQHSEKVEHGCTTTNLPLYSGIKIDSVLQRPPSWRNLAHNLVHKRDRQTDGQKTETFLAVKAAGEIRAPPNLAW